MDLSPLVLLPRAVLLLRQFVVNPPDEILLGRSEAGGGVVEGAASIEREITSLSLEVVLLVFREVLTEVQVQGLPATTEAGLRGL